VEPSHCWCLKLEDSASARSHFIPNGFARRFFFLGTFNYDYEPRDFLSTEHTTEHAASLNSAPNAFVSIHEHALLSAFLNLSWTSYPHASYVVTFSSHVLTDPSEVVSLTLSLCNWEMFHIFHYVFDSKSFQPSRTYNWHGTEAWANSSDLKRADLRNINVNTKRSFFNTRIPQTYAGFAVWATEPVPRTAVDDKGWAVIAVLTVFAASL
jgi:hypothetical protein